MLFVKPFSYPEIYFTLKELLARLPETHIVKPMVAAEFSRKEQGLIGEKKVLYYLEMLSETKYYIFHNLRLQYKHRFFQMDYLILCSAFALILEVKDITGDLHFDKNFNQMIVVKKTSKKKRKNPVLQASIQAWKLKGWLKENHIPEVPIHYLFVNANEDSELVTVPGNEQTAKKIVNSEGLVDKIEQIANYYTMDSLETKTIKKLCKLLLTSHTPEDPDVLKEFHLSPKDLISGVRCLNCDTFSMKYIYGTWHCSNCPYTSKTAHIPTIETYFLLIKPWITNSELRDFIKISSPKTAHRILNSMDLEHKGTLKGRIYYPKHHFFPQNMHKTPANNKK